MSYLTLSITIPILLLLGGAVLHMHNLNYTYKKMVGLVGPGVTKAALYKEMTVAQGSNFTAMAMAAWIMLFVAISYLYFLVPGALPYSFMMQMPELVSSEIGFFVFGVVMALVATILIWSLDMMPNSYRNLKPSELYSFYDISRELKKYIILPIILLSSSIIISAYSGTIYPSRNPFAELLSFIFLVLSIGILILPIWRGRE
jgi:hypothetical protein